MFGTLRYEARNEDGEFLQHEAGTAGRLQRMVCDNCRVKKGRFDAVVGGQGAIDAQRSTYPESTPSQVLENDSPRNGWHLHPTTPAEAARIIKLPRSFQARAQNRNQKIIVPPIINRGEEFQEEDEQMFNNFDWYLGEKHSSLASPSLLTAAPTIDLPTESDKRLSTSTEPESGTPQDKRTSHGAPHIYSSNLMDDHMVLDPTVLHTSPYITPTPSIKSQPPSVFLLDELEGSNDAGVHEERKTLDSQPSSYREVLSRCESILQCPQCRRRPENMTVLNLVLERQTSLASSIIDAYLVLTSADSDNSTTTIESVVQPTSTRVSSIPTALEPPEMFLGEYSIAKSEWKNMVRVLVLTQMSAFDRLIAQMKQVPLLAQRHSQMTRLRTSKLQNRRIARRLWPDLPDTFTLSDPAIYFMSWPK
ncbi:uncharacterized protein N7483_000467 [Penicillium malachiteum]|uniref:uncharacterized protein n=1 Tax=Penicillium malachiteum TaxID=1324776 RepID=UPI002549C03E|nr:uncharacterized protein N7483_000467 [Penicillium malachiteum]KAJ5735342.1 hypothetical protein N7483_000467 [Penicillium malachiteum]